MVGDNMNKEVIVKTPSRLHIGLIDLNGSIGRVDGGLGLVISKPNFTVRVSKGENFYLDVPEQYYEQALSAVNLINGHFKFDNNIKVKFDDIIPPHTGLGSGTQLALGIGYAICKLNEKPVAMSELIHLIGRGGTSGVGVTAFEKGGFILDGGHSFGCSSTKNCFAPTSASKGVPPPPILMRLDFPENWKILLVIPKKGSKVSGAEEKRLFEDLCPIPLNDVQSICHVILLKLLPALFERDLHAFGSSINDIQKFGWKKIEVEKQDPVISQTMEYLRKEGAAGVGLSSWGPLIYCFGDNLENLKTKAEDYLETRGGGISMIVFPNNHGLECIERS